MLSCSGTTHTERPLVFILFALCCWYFVNGFWLTKEITSYHHEWLGPRVPTHPFSDSSHLVVHSAQWHEVEEPEAGRC